MNKDYNKLSASDYEETWETKHNPLNRKLNSDIPNPYLHTEVYGTGGMDPVTSNQEDNPYIFDPSNNDDLINFASAVVQLKDHTEYCVDGDEETEKQKDYHKIISAVFNYIDVALPILPSEREVRSKFINTN